MKVGLWAGLVSCWMLATSCLCAKPTIIEEPSDVTVKQGDDVTLRCVVEHLPSDDLSPVQWTRGDFALGFDRNLSNWDRYSMVGDISIGEYNLHIKDVNLQEDESQYECQVTMHYMRTRKAAVTVLVPPNGPVIDNMLKDGITVNAVADVENVFICRAYGGKPAANITWYKNGVEMTEGFVNVISSTNKLFNTTSTLRVTPTVDDVDDMYACVMKSDAMDTMESAMMKLKVQKPPIVSVSLPPSISEGDYVRAECRAVADPPVISYRWFVNGEIQSDVVSSTFNIDVVDKNWHNILLGCQGRNEAGYSKINQVTVDVKYPPVFVSGTQDQTLEIGDNVTLSCEWDSNPPPSVYWYKAGTDVILGNGGSLFLFQVEQEDGGSYVCAATAGNFGKSEAMIGLRVRGSPIISSPHSQEVRVGEDSIVECRLSSFPGIEQVTWSWTLAETTFTLRGNESVTSSGDVISGEEGKVKYQGVVGEGSASLHIYGTSPEDIHTYSCAVENSYGADSMEIILVEDAGDDGDVIMLGTAIGCALGGLFILIVLVVVCALCVKSRRQRKSTNFEKELKNTKSSKFGDRSYTEDETIPIHHQRELEEDFNVRSPRSSQIGGGGSSVDGSDDTNPTPTSGQDDGYHTEEAHSWNRSNQPGEKSSSVASPAKSSSIINSYNPGLMMPSHLEEDQDVYMEEPDYPPTSYPTHYPSHTMSPSRYGYDPTALVNPNTIRSASVLGDRFSPPAHYLERKLSDASAPASTSYRLAPEYFPQRTYTPVLDYRPPSNFGGNRNTPIPSTITGGTDPFYQLQGGSSQSSLDKFERGSALSASAVAARAIEPYESGARMNSMSSRMSQSSRSSDYLRPLQARMATHV